MKAGLKAEVLEAIIRRIVEVARPDKIILFGSAARGERGPNSDVDLLVIKSGGPSATARSGDLPESFRRWASRGCERCDPRGCGKIPGGYWSYHRTGLYPGLAEPVTQKEYEEAVAMAERVVRWVETIIIRGSG